MIYLPAIVAVLFYIKKLRSLAIGIAAFGSGLGTFVFARLTNTLLTEYSWKGTVLIDAAILLKCILCGMTFRPVKFSQNQDPAEGDAVREEKSTDTVQAKESRMGKKSSSIEFPQTSSTSARSAGRRRQFGESQRSTVTEMMDLRLFIDVVFILFAVSNFLTSFGFVVPYIFLPDRGYRQFGFTSEQAAFLISVVGISNMVGRVFGCIADLKCVSKLILYNTVLVLCGICSVFNGLLTTFRLQMCYSFIFGLSIGRCEIARTAKRGIAIVSHPSVRLSVRNVDVPWAYTVGWTSSKLITPIISLGSSLLGATTSAI